MAASYTQVFNKYSVEGFPGVCTVWGFSKRLYALKITLRKYNLDRKHFTVTINYELTLLDSIAL